MLASCIILNAPQKKKYIYHLYVKTLPKIIADDRLDKIVIKLGTLQKKKYI